VEAISILIAYPLFILSWNQLLSISKIQGWVEASHRHAERYRPVIQKYGIYGLFAFVWFPFWMTGPVPGSFVGYLMGLRHRITLTVVIAGTLVATIGWAYALEWLQSWAESVDPRAPWMIVGAIIAAVVAATLWRYVRKGAS